MGRPPIGKQAMTAAERQRRRRAKSKSEPVSGAPKRPPPVAAGVAAGPPPKAAAPAPAKDHKAMERLQATLEMTKTMWEADRRRFSEAVTENARLKAEIKTLTEHGPPWMKIQLRNARSDIAELRREVAELTALTRLPDEVHKRYRASCTRWRAKKQAELNSQWRSLEERERESARAPASSLSRSG